MAEVQLKRKITLRRKEKPAEFTFDGLHYCPKKLPHRFS